MRLLTSLVIALLVAGTAAGCGGGASSTGTAATPAGATSTDATAAGTTPTVTATSTASVDPTAPAATTTSSQSTTTTTTTTTRLASSTTTRAATTTSTTSGCGKDCQTGAPTAAGATKPVNGKCPANTTYLPPQDGGPALCVPSGSFSQTSTSP